MLTRASYESKYISTGLSPSDVNYRPGGVCCEPRWLTSFVPFHSGIINCVQPDSPLPDVDEDSLCAAFGLVSVGVDDEGVAIFDFIRAPQVGCVHSAQRIYEPWPDLGWGTHALQRRYPVEPWVKVVHRGTIRRQRRLQRRSKLRGQPFKPFSGYMGIERRTAKPGSQFRDGGKHHKDEMRRERRHIHPVQRRKHHKRVFDSTLGYPGEGPKGKDQHRQDRKAARWKLVEPEVKVCDKNRACNVRGHWHILKGDPLSGSARRHEEKKGGGRVKKEAKYKRCDAPFPRDCDFKDMFCDGHGHDLAQHHDDLIHGPGDLDHASVAQWSGIDGKTFDDPDFPEAHLGAIDPDVLDFASGLGGDDLDTDSVGFHFRGPNTLPELEHVASLIGLPEHPSGIEQNFCVACANENGMCDVLGDVTGNDRSDCLSCLHSMMQHGTSHLRPRAEAKYPPPSPPIPPSPLCPQVLPPAPVLPPKKQPKPVVPPLPSLQPMPPPLSPLPISLGPAPPPPKSVGALVQHLDKVFVVDIANPMTLIDRVVYLSGDAPEPSCFNCCFNILKHTPCVVQEDEFLINDWKREFLREVEEAIPSYETRLRWKWSVKLFSRQRKLRKKVQWLKCYNLAMRVRVYGEMVRVLLENEQVCAVKVLREDGTSVASARSAVEWVCGKLTSSAGVLWAPLWKVDAAAFSHSIDAVINQLVKRNINAFAVLPGKLSVRPDFPNMGF